MVILEVLNLLLVLCSHFSLTFLGYDLFVCVCVC